MRMNEKVFSLSLSFFFNYSMRIESFILDDEEVFSFWVVLNLNCVWDIKLVYE